jgi:dihydrofolate reductase
LGINKESFSSAQSSQFRICENERLAFRNWALEEARKTNCKEIFIIGGGEIYKASMQLADRIYLTRVHTHIEGDTFFPELDPNVWELSQSQSFLKDEKNAFDHDFEIWDKRK